MDRISRVRAEIEDVKGIMLENIGTPLCWLVCVCFHRMWRQVGVWVDGWFSRPLTNRWCFADKVLERGDRIEILVDKTATLMNQSFKFKEGAKELKCAMWWKNVKLWIIIAIVVVVRLTCGPCCLVGVCLGARFPRGLARWFIAEDG